MRKFFDFLRDLKKNFFTVNKRKTKITSRCKCMLYLWRKNLKKAL